LRAQFDDQVEDFVQDQKIDALVDEVAGGELNGSDAAPPDLDPQVGRASCRAREGTSPDDAAAIRAEVQQAVDTYAPEPGQAWAPPEGTSPEDAAAFRAELQQLVDPYAPVPGQSADAALAALRAQFDDQVEDFVQDQKIDALVDEVAGGELNGSDAAPPDLDPRLTTRPGDLGIDTTLVDDFDAMATPVIPVEPLTATPVDADAELSGLGVKTAPTVADVAPDAVSTFDDDPLGIGAVT